MEQISRKHACLLALITGHRVHTLHLLDIKCMSTSTDGIHFVIPKLIKTSWPRFHPQAIYLEKFELNNRLCVVFYIRKYLDRARDIRGEASKLFIIHTKLYKAVSKATLSRWIRKQLIQCGIDMKVFVTHSTRAAATSRANQLVPLSVVMKSAAWTNTSTFGKHYNKPIMGDS